MIMKSSEGLPLKENNINSLNSKKKATPIIPYETELVNNGGGGGGGGGDDNDLFKETKYNTRQKRSVRSRHFTTRSSPNSYNNDKSSNSNYYNKRPKYQHTKLEPKKSILDQNDDDFQEIQAYINKHSKFTKNEEEKVEKGKENTKTKYNNTRNRKYSKLLINDSDDDNDSNNILESYGIKKKGLKPSSSSSSLSSNALSQTKSKYKKESSPSSPFNDVNRKKSSIFYARKSHYNTNKRYQIVSYNQPDDTTSDSDNTTEDESKNSKTNVKFKTKAAKEKFVLPEKRSKKNSFLLAPLPKFSDPFQHEKSQTISKKSVECPYCHSFINIDDSNIVTEAYEKIKNIESDSASINHKSNNDTDDTDDDDNHHHQNKNKNFLSIKSTKSSISNMELYDFCRLHTSELNIKPYCIKQGWPITILFDELEERIYSFKSDLDKIIYQKMDSYYRTLALEAYQEMGKHKARSTMGMLARFEKTMPGYYGAKGSYIIQNLLVKMYLHKRILNKELTSPQLPMEYIQQVLVPEVGYRLIREDLIKDGKSKPKDPNIDDEAKKIMAKSFEAGSYLHPLTDDIDDLDLIDDN